jgi:hypothetical protein
MAEPESPDEYPYDTEPPPSAPTEPRPSPFELFSDLFESVTSLTEEEPGRPKKLFVRWRLDPKSGVREIYACTETRLPEPLGENEHEGEFS